MAESKSDQPEAKRKRTASRLAAVQALYQIDVTGASPATAIIEHTRHNLGGNAPDESFGDADEQMFAELVEGTAARREDIDRGLSSALSADWPLERLEIILRAILRVAVYELLARPGVPARVIISEYLDIAHAFFAGKEPGLVNGVLDRLARSIRSEGLRDDQADSAAPR
ncbi:MAG TPA: transcription antitermination factor NusB [Stellaceae bacterium]|jgi:N utilization substance protein B|nr:transcription antitermination factor NusB [Stellaceae bacterium]